MPEPKQGHLSMLPTFLQTLIVHKKLEFSCQLQAACNRICTFALGMGQMSLSHRTCAEQNARTFQPHFSHPNIWRFSCIWQLPSKQENPFGSDLSHAVWMVSRNSLRITGSIAILSEYCRNRWIFLIGKYTYIQRTTKRWLQLFRKSGYISKVTANL